MKPCIHVLVDGQFGSTGKGLYADYLARKMPGYFDTVVSNAGPNSGHTFYYEDRKVVLKQLPTFAVSQKLNHNINIPVVLSAGAIINPDLLKKEAEEHGIQVFLSGRAAVIRPEDVEAEHSGSVAAVAGTRSGVGAALARKVLREPDAVVAGRTDIGWGPNIKVLEHDNWPWHKRRAFVEVSQGFSLGLNSEFYPKVTSRECTVAQALSDARMPPQLVDQVHMVVRTYPIRVGNVDGHSSGDWYEDQRETDWASIPVPPAEPERTTVTQRVRRVADFSHRQLRDALRANHPNTLLLNFMNYLEHDQQEKLLAAVRATCYDAVGYAPQIRLGLGATAGLIRDTQFK